MDADQENKLIEVVNTLNTGLTRLVDVLVLNHTISLYDAQYIQGKVNQEDWYKEATKSPSELFLDLLQSYKNIPKEDKEKPNEN